MVNATQIQSTINTRIFSGTLATTALYSSLVVGSLNMYGDALTSSYTTASTIIVVPADAFNTKEFFFMFGNMQKGDQDILLKPDQAVEIGDKIVLAGSTYRVKLPKTYYAGATPLFTAVRLTEFI